MSGVLVLYVDALDDVHAAAVAPERRDAGSAAWRQLQAAVGPAAALADYRQRVHLLPPAAEVRYVVQRAGADGRQVCAYRNLSTARAAVQALAGQTDYLYIVTAEVAA